MEESEFEQKYQNKRYSAQRQLGSFEAALSNGENHILQLPIPLYWNGMIKPHIPGF
jgi:hypothetical protein